MSKHTPGPWAAGRQGDVDTGEPLPWLSVCERGREEVICEVKREADARLIAAAPDLLAVCEALLPDLACHCGEGFTSRGRHAPNSLCHHYDDVRRAMAKARRET